MQIAYGVVDVRAAAARRAAATGAGPFVVADHIGVTSSRVHGHPAPFDHSSAYGQWGPLMVELVEEHTPPIVAPGNVHHVAFMVESLPAAMSWCVDQGWPEALWAATATGQEFAFMDARADLGHLVELYEPSDRLVAFYATVAALADAWDGSHPVR
ncbi:VOC family protein [Desertimonas flava]|uniref:VOC family protein n=1 Tax=Desertimonas flava TaxID=2064846 RepID=UPI00196996A8|nr:VOC family protein [Desertimonas flava]